MSSLDPAVDSPHAPAEACARLSGEAHGDAEADDDRGFLVYARTGDAAALESVLGLHAERAHALARRILGNSADAEDAVQEALARLVATAGRYDGSIPFGAWLGQLVIEASRQVRRSRTRRVRRERTACACGPEPMPTEDDLVEEVRKVVADLPERYRSVVELHYFQGLSHEETALALGVKTDAVAQRIHRARERIRQRLHGLRGSVALLAMPTLEELLRHPAFAGPRFAPTGAAAAWGAPAAAWGCALAAIITWIAIAFELRADGAHAVIRDAATLIAASAQPVSDEPAIADAPEAGDGDDVVASAAVSSNVPVPPRGAPLTAHRAVALTAPVSWSFDDPADERRFTVLVGAWHHEATGGRDGSGCMRIDSPYFAAAIDTPIPQVPLRLTALGRIDTDPDPAGFVVTAMWERWDMDEMVCFHGIGAPVLGDEGFELHEAFVGERTIDLWSEGHRRSLVGQRRQPGARLCLFVRGRYVIDDVRVEPMDAGAMPDTAAFARALDAVPSADRHDSVPMPDPPPVEGIDPERPVTMVYVDVASQTRGLFASVTPSPAPEF